MNTSKTDAGREHQPPPSGAARAGQAERGKRAPEADAAQGGAANQGSPAAPVMKQFQKTKAESSGRR